MEYQIVIPVHNEEKYISKLLGSFDKTHLKKVIFVDDGSSDKTAEIIKNFHLTKESPHFSLSLIRHKTNKGKGMAMKSGVEKALKKNPEIIILMDGDQQHNPKDIDRFLRAFKKQPKLDIIFGARKIGKNMRFFYFLGNKVLTVLLNLLFHYFVNDSQCGFRAFKANVFPKISWKSPGYSAETEMIINAARHKLKYREITINTLYLDYKKGTHFKDGVSILLKTIYWRIFK